MSARIAGEEPDPLDLDFPGVQDGARGVDFIHRAIESAEKHEWLKVDYTPPGA
jgi:hypothetical protein